MKKYTPLIIGVVIVLFGLFVWPTMYRYDKLNQKWPVRINRLTGNAEMLTVDGWTQLNPPSKPSNSTETTTNTILDSEHEAPPSNPTNPQSNQLSIPSSEQSLQSTGNIPTPNLVCSDVNFIKGQYGTFSVTGIVKNTGNGTAIGKLINITVYDKNNIILATNVTMIGVLKPGQEESFSVPVLISSSSDVSHVSAKANG